MAFLSLSLAGGGGAVGLRAVACGTLVSAPGGPGTGATELDLCLCPRSSSPSHLCTGQRVPWLSLYIHSQRV